MSPSYLQELEAWNSDREQWIKERYLKIFYMDQLSEGLNSVGSDSANHLLVEYKGFPPQFGQLHLQSDSVTFQSTLTTFINGKQLLPANARYTLYKPGVNDSIVHEQYTLFLFKEADGYYLRIRDENHPSAANYRRPPSFRPDREFIIHAQFVPDSSLIETPLSLFGSVVEHYSGYLQFEYQGNEYRLRVKGRQLEFGDETNGKSTYGGGRYLLYEIKQDNSVLLDFNKSYSPPCAYSIFTICPLPPPENQLPFEINAGQMYLSD